MKALSLNYKTFLSDINLDYYKSIALFRISVVLIALIDFSSVWIDLNIFISDTSLIPWELGLIETEYYNFLKPLFDFLISNNIRISTFISIIAILYITALISSGLGFHKNKSIFFAIIFQIILYRSISNFNYGYDNFITMSLFYCLIFPVAREFSLDKWKTKQNSANELPFYFSLTNFLRTHLSIIYFVSGLAKAVDKNWWNGNAIWRSMANLNDFIYLSPFILLVLSCSTVIMEMSYPFIAFSKFKNLKRILIIHIILMHLGIGIVLGLSSFASIMIVWNITAFYKDFTEE
ncbi:hypothetical protein QYS48_22300 [Marivirga arenosa]|uniref:HTTM-like domain-containing protein n=1 Tax=Marivirga arenosa TaxID=3059076 RepID=A0AA49GFN5_9BACT|nr:hypothetical protein [Marivirga sp. ABR2-2]WKK84811.2 hypothetical protein QYS48_22300 [Marivirga sp. ABR2-2]